MAKNTLYWGSEIKAYFTGIPVEYCQDGKTWNDLKDANLFNNEKYSFRIKPSSGKHNKKFLFVSKNGKVTLVKPEIGEYHTIIIWMMDGEVDLLEVVK